eukprot:TRINITY_DN30958_c0_g1_i1.p1 TRINITY_DN30958_c0_g1~~TRINITY_DN30958_c0_g1_i1.p1  ORF type:complete len:1064 (-),score=169.11 TRINITY_DN30958_c0_g1_i1:63-3254(-)
MVKRCCFSNGAAKATKVCPEADDQLCCSEGHAIHQSRSDRPCCTRFDCSLCGDPCDNERWCCDEDCNYDVCRLCFAGHYATLLDKIKTEEPVRRLRQLVIVSDVRHAVLEFESIAADILSNTASEAENLEDVLRVLKTSVDLGFPIPGPCSAKLTCFVRDSLAADDLTACVGLLKTAVEFQVSASREDLGCDLSVSQLRVLANSSLELGAPDWNQTAQLALPHAGNRELVASADSGLNSAMEKLRELRDLRIDLATTTFEQGWSAAIQRAAETPDQALDLLVLVPDRFRKDAFVAASNAALHLAISLIPVEHSERFEGLKNLTGTTAKLCVPLPEECSVLLGECVRDSIIQDDLATCEAAVALSAGCGVSVVAASVKDLSFDQLQVLQEISEKVGCSSWKEAAKNGLMETGREKLLGATEEGCSRFMEVLDELAAASVDTSDSVFEPAWRAIVAVSVGEPASSLDLLCAVPTGLRESFPEEFQEATETALSCLEHTSDMLEASGRLRLVKLPQTVVTRLREDICASAAATDIESLQTLLSAVAAFDVQLETAELEAAMGHHLQTCSLFLRVAIDAGCQETTWMKDITIICSQLAVDEIKLATSLDVASLFEAVQAVQSVGLVLNSLPGSDELAPMIVSLLALHAAADARAGAGEIRSAEARGGDAEAGVGDAGATAGEAEATAGDSEVNACHAETNCVNSANAKFAGEPLSENVRDTLVHAALECEPDPEKILASVAEDLQQSAYTLLSPYISRWTFAPNGDAALPDARWQHFCAEASREIAAAFHKFKTFHDHRRVCIGVDSAGNPKSWTRGTTYSLDFNVMTCFLTEPGRRGRVVPLRVQSQDGVEPPPDKPHPYYLKQVQDKDAKDGDWMSNVFFFEAFTHALEAAGISVDKPAHEIFDFRWNEDFRELQDTGKKMYRGGEEYRLPFGWKRFAVDVKGEYDDGDNKWLGSGDGSWAIAYHGTSEEGLAGILATGFRVGPRQKFAGECGSGVYCTPFVEVAADYAPRNNIRGHIIQIVLQLRIKPSAIKRVTTGTDFENKYWVINDPADMRAYGALIRQKD